MIVYRKCRHPFTKENSYYWNSRRRRKSGKRFYPECRTCRALKARIRWRSRPEYRARSTARSIAWAKKNPEARREHVRRWRSTKGRYAGQDPLQKAIYRDMRRIMIAEGAWPNPGACP